MESFLEKSESECLIIYRYQPLNESSAAASKCPQLHHQFIEYPWLPCYRNESISPWSEQGILGWCSSNVSQYL
jgi:hypothetical protein